MELSTSLPWVSTAAFSACSLEGRESRAPVGFTELTSPIQLRCNAFSTHIQYLDHWKTLGIGEGRLKGFYFFYLISFQRPGLQALTIGPRLPDSITIAFSIFNLNLSEARPLSSPIFGLILGDLGGCKVAFWNWKGKEKADPKEAPRSSGPSLPGSSVPAQERPLPNQRGISRGRL